MKNYTCHLSVFWLIFWCKFCGHLPTLLDTDPLPQAICIKARLETFKKETNQASDEATKANRKSSKIKKRYIEALKEVERLRDNIRQEDKEHASEKARLAMEC